MENLPLEYVKLAERLISRIYRIQRQKIRAANLNGKHELNIEIKIKLKWICPIRKCSPFSCANCGVDLIRPVIVSRLREGQAKNIRLCRLESNVTLSYDLGI